MLRWSEDRCGAGLLQVGFADIRLWSAGRRRRWRPRSQSLLSTSRSVTRPAHGPVRRERIASALVNNPSGTSGGTKTAPSHADDPWPRRWSSPTMADVQEVEVVVAHNERATLRVGDVFLKIDGDQAYTNVEVEAMALARSRLRRSCGASRRYSRWPPCQGRHSAASGEPSTASPTAWARRVPPYGCARRAAAAMARPQPRQDRSAPGQRCEWLLTNGGLPADLVTRNRTIAKAALRPWTPVFRTATCGSPTCSLTVRVTGVINWSKAARAMPCTTSPSSRSAPEHLGEVRRLRHRRDLDMIRAWWSLRSLLAVHWLIERGFDRPRQAARSTC